MKKIIMMLLVLVFMLGCQGFTSMEIQPSEFKVVKEVSEVKQDVIFNKISKYIASNFKSAKSTIDYSNILDGTITCNIGIPGYWEHPTAGDVSMTIVPKILFSIKDGKFKTEILSIIIWNDKCTPSDYGRCDSKTFYNQEQYNRFYNDINKMLDEMIVFIKSDDSTW